MARRLALLTPFAFPSVRGNAVTVERIARGLRAAGADVEVWDLSTMVRDSLERRASEYRPALIHAFHAYRAGPLGLALARRIGCPLVVTLTGTDANLDLFDAERAPAVRQVLESAAAVTVFHDSVAALVARAAPEIPARIVVVPQSVDFQDPSLPAVPAPRARGPVMLFPAGVRPIKRPLFPLLPLDAVAARHPGFEMSAWEIMDRTLRTSGMWDAETNWRRGGQDFALPFQTAHFLDGFPTADGRFHFKADWGRFGGRSHEMPVLPDHFDVIDAATPDRPFRLVAAPARTFLNSTFTETPSSQERERRPTALLHPDDCAALGVADGDPVRLGNARGEVVVRAKAQGGQQRGVVVVEGIWPNRRFDGGIGINALTSADPGWPHGGAVFHDTAVSIRRA